MILHISYKMTLFFILAAFLEKFSENSLGGLLEDAM
jgi:hypothetical protein